MKEIKSANDIIVVPVSYFNGIEASEVQCIRIFTVSLSANMVVWHHTKASSESISQMHMSLLIAIQHQCSCRNRFHARMHIMNELFPYYIARKGKSDEKSNPIHHRCGGNGVFLGCRVLYG